MKTEDGKKTEHRIIVVGSEGHHGVESISWDAGSIPNLADYESVILSTSSLGELLVQARAMPEEQRRDHLTDISNNLYFVMVRLLHVLNSKGNVYVVCSKPVRTPYGSNQFGAIRNYDWLPLPVRLIEESGRTIELRDKSYQHYFEFVDKWPFCFEEVTENDKYVELISELHGGKYLVILGSREIALNRYGKSIAISLEYDLYKKPRYGEKFAYKDRTDTSGSLILLPPPTKIDVREAINILLSELWGIQQKTPPPEGVESILLPGEEAIKQDIEKVRKEVHSLENTIATLEVALAKKAEIKQLVFETGIPLEDVCKLVLRELGCGIDDSVEDFLLTYQAQEAVVEVKGREGTIERKDGAQLAQNRRNYAISREKATNKVKAVLLGNPCRLLFPLEERDKKDPFAPHLVEDAQTEDTALVTTMELFNAYYAFVEGRVTADKIISRIFSSVGVTKLVE